MRYLLIVPLLLLAACGQQRTYGQANETIEQSADSLKNMNEDAMQNGGLR